MYSSQNLPLSPLKVVKKTIQRGGGTLAILIPLGFLFGYATIFGAKMEGVGFEGIPFVRGAFFISLVLIFLFSICVLIYEYLYYKMYYYNFEDDGAEVRKGVVARATGHVRYERLQNIYVDQDFLDRIFGLYDIHYETAGETSGFYSHVDGLDKTNADKLVKFLNEKARGGQGQYNIARSSDVSDATDNIAQSGGQADNSIAFSRKNCPISPLVVASRISHTTFFLLLLSLFFWFDDTMGLNRSSSFTNFGVLIYKYWPHLIISLGALLFFLQCIWYKNFYFSFGSGRGEIRSKVIGQSVSYLYYDRIQNINIGQGALERLFGIYTLSIETAGEASGVKLILPGFTRQNAEKIRDFLLEKARKYKGRL